MTIDYERLKGRVFAELEHRYTQRDTIIYALGIGLGNDPLDEKALSFVYEEGLKAMPTMAAVLAYPGFWLKQPDTGVDWVKVVHAEQEVIIHKPLPVEGTVVATTRVTEIVDKGEGRGAFIYSDRTVRDKATGEALCTLAQTSMARGDGGFGGPAVSVDPPHRVPDRKADLQCDLPTLPQAALLYRLSGDDNPLHASPSVARAAGFKAPILHGMCTFGVAGHAILRACCDYDTTRFHRIKARFSKPVYPGETIRTEIWREGSHVSFRCSVLGRNLVVINNGYAEIS